MTAKKLGFLGQGFMIVTVACIIGAIFLEKTWPTAILAALATVTWIGGVICFWKQNKMNAAESVRQAQVMANNAASRRFADIFHFPPDTDHDEARRKKIADTLEWLVAVLAQEKENLMANEAGFNLLEKEFRISSVERRAEQLNEVMDLIRQFGWN
jgi:hypothetical protein